MREFGRDLRIADFIRDELAAIIQREMRDPRVGMVSVNEAKVSKDLSWADVYVSSFETKTDDERAELIEVLNKAAGYFRSELAKRHSMRTTPKLIRLRTRAQLFRLYGAANSQIQERSPCSSFFHRRGNLSLRKRRSVI